MIVLEILFRDINHIHIHIWGLQINFQIFVHSFKFVFFSFNHTNNLIYGLFNCSPIHYHISLGCYINTKVVQRFSASILCDGCIYKDFRNIFFLANMVPDTTCSILCLEAYMPHLIAFKSLNYTNT